MVFCNLTIGIITTVRNGVTILILVDGFLQLSIQYSFKLYCVIVTILILVDGFLQFLNEGMLKSAYKGHNPYFSRWFSAIKITDFGKK